MGSRSDARLTTMRRSVSLVLFQSMGGKRDIPERRKAYNHAPVSLTSTVPIHGAGKRDIAERRKTYNHAPVSLTSTVLTHRAGKCDNSQVRNKHRKKTISLMTQAIPPKPVRPVLVLKKMKRIKLHVSLLLPLLVIYLLGIVLTTAATAQCPDCHRKVGAWRGHTSLSQTLLVWLWEKVFPQNVSS